AEHEEIRRRSFRNVAVGIQNDRFVKAGPYGVGLDESRVDICARDLAARRKTVIVDAAPGGNRHVHILFVLVVGAEWHDHNRNFRCEVVKANANDFVRIESQRANVEIFLVSLGANQLDQPLQQIVAACLQLHAKQLRGLQEAAKVITGSENEKLLLILVPVSAEPAKYGGSVIQSVCEHAEFHLGIRNDSAVMEDEIWQWHGFTSALSLSHEQAPEPVGAPPEKPAGLPLRRTLLQSKKACHGLSSGKALWKPMAPRREKCPQRSGQFPSWFPTPIEANDET